MIEQLQKIGDKQVIFGKKRTCTDVKEVKHGDEVYNYVYQYDDDDDLQFTNEELREVVDKL